MLKKRRARCSPLYWLRSLALVAAAGSLATPASAIEISDTLEGSFGLPEINVIIRPDESSAPFEGEDPIILDPLISLRLVFDTGASGVIVGTEPAGQLGVPTTPQISGEVVTFYDVGIGGETTFGVSNPVHLSIGHFTAEPPTEYENDADYPRQYPGVRLQLGPPGLFSNVVGRLSLAGIAGMPVMLDRVSIIEPKRAETFVDTIHTYVYKPGVASTVGPGILTADLHVELTLTPVDRFTRVEPAGAPSPTLTPNPFIGPNPLAVLDGDSPSVDDAPGIVLISGAERTVGSLLLDTGAQISSISSALAARLNVRVRIDTEGTSNPVLERFDPNDPGRPGTAIADQFSTITTGVGGSETLVGFYLDKLVLRTREGDASNDDDPWHVTFTRAPVFVQDIGLRDPVTGQEFVLDGIFGMNYLMASVTPSNPFVFKPGAFDALVLDFDSNSHAPAQLGLVLTDGIEWPPTQSANPLQVPLPIATLIALVLSLSLAAFAGRRSARKEG